MKKILSTSALCLGIVGAAVVDTHAQNLFVANLGNGTVPGTVSGYDATGALVSNFGGNGLNQPVGLAANGGSLYVTSYDTATNTSSILRLDGSGTTPVVVNSPTSGSALQNPKEITFGANVNTLYVANGGNLPTVNNSYVGVANVATGGYTQPNVGAGGGFGGNGSALNAAYSLAYDGTRYLYAGNGADNNIIRFDTTLPNSLGTTISLSADAGATTAGVTSIGVLNGLTIGPDGALYATDGVNRDVLRIASPQSNASIFSIFVDGNGATPATRLVGPEGLIFDPTGTFLYVSNDDNTIKRIAVANIGGIENASGPVTPFVTEANGSNPGFLAFSSVPEPSTYALFGVAGAAMLVFGLKRRQQLTLRA